jgi:hypothetical protein
MGRINNLKASKLSPLKSQVRRVEMTNGLDSGSVDNGTTTYRGNESLKIVGSAVVSGWLVITGTLKLVGNLLMEGAATFTGTLTAAGAALFTGALTSRGTTRFEGDTSQIGPLHVVGATDLTGDLTVNSPGRISVLGTIAMIIGQISGGRAGIQFPSGVLSGLSDRILLENGAALVGASSGSAVMLYGSAPYGVLANATGVNLSIPTAVTTSPANIFRNAGGYLQISSSAARYKIDPRPMDLPSSLLDDVPIEWWFDAGNAERRASLVGKPRPYTEVQQQTADATEASRRIPGVIAEKVVAAGGEAFVTRDEDGELQGVMYERLANARTAILAERNIELERRVGELEARLAEVLKILGLRDLGER